MSNPFRQAAALEGLVNKERASALGFTGERLTRQLAKVKALRDAPVPAPGPARNRAAASLAEAEREVARLLWNLIVQREAMGLTRHDEVYSQYGIPRSVVPVAR